MKRRGLSMVLLSLVFGVAAAWAAKSWIEQRTRATHVTEAGATVVVAAMEIPFGTRIEGRHVKVITVPSGTTLGNHFGSITEIEGLIATQRVQRINHELAHRAVVTNAVGFAHALPDQVILLGVCLKSCSGSFARKVGLKSAPSTATSQDWVTQ